ncbi:hypothetical protein AAKU55_002691 [Oxalobacteraceae bacterium GrIS 1.11]
MKQSIEHWAAILFVCLGCISCLGGCGATSNAVAAPTSKSYDLTVGQTIPITAIQSLKLDRVNDSRCKKGAVCVWAGYISYSFTLSGDGAASTFVLSDSMPGGTPSATQQKLTFALVAVDPAAPPVLNAPEPAYRVTIKVSTN